MTPDRRDPSSPDPDSPAAWFGAALAALFLGVYGPACGRGFLSDDFAWILRGRLQDPSDLWRVLDATQGFYRPLVSLSFGINHALFGLDPRGYGWTNRALAMACGGFVFALARALRLPPGPSMAAAGIWLFNLHGINMAVWLSGRTSLLVTVFSLVAAVALLQRRPWLAGGGVAAALVAKEEAVVLPALLTVWGWLLRRPGARAAMPGWPPPAPRVYVAAWALLLVYLALRASSDAFWFQSAPEFYQPRLDLLGLARNVREYADRGLTTSAVAVLLTWLIVRRRPEVTPHTRLAVALGGVWVAGGYAITVFLPVRSSLYAVLPSVGAALAAAAVIDALARSVDAAGRARLAVAVSSCSWRSCPCIGHATPAGPSWPMYPRRCWRTCVPGRRRGQPARGWSSRTIARRART